MMIPIQRRIFQLILGFSLFVVLAMTWQHARTALIKPLYMDEINEIAHTCSKPFHEMITLGGSGQCSPNPLHYLIQKILANFFQNPYQTDLFQLLFRMISITSFMGLGLLIMGIGNSLAGPGGMLLALTAWLTIQPLSDLVIESRPYLSWLFLLVAWAFSHYRWISTRTTLWAVLSIFSGVLLAFNVGPGFIQIFVTTFLFWFYLQERSLARKNLAVPLTLILSTTGIGLYYLSLSCPLSPDSYGSPYDLLLSKDPKLVLGVLRLLIPKGWDQIAISCLTVLGFSQLVRFNFKRSSHPALRLFLLALVIATAVTTVGVILKHYFFVQRVFIHLSVLRAIAVALGTMVLIQWIQKRHQKIKWLSPVAMNLFFATLAVPALWSEWNRLDLRFKNTPRLEVNQIPCEQLKQPLHVQILEGAVDQPAFSVIPIVSKMRKTCGLGVPQGEPVDLVVTEYSESLGRAQLELMPIDQLMPRRKFIPVCGMIPSIR